MTHRSLKWLNGAQKGSVTLKTTKKKSWGSMGSRWLYKRLTGLIRAKL